MKRTAIIFILILTMLFGLASCGRAEKSYEKLDEHIVSTVTEADGVRTLTLGESTEGDSATYSRVAKRTDKAIVLELTVSESGTAFYTFSLIIKRDAFDSYEWEYATGGETMYGNINPEEYQKGAYSLSYLGTNMSVTVAPSAAVLAKDLCNALLGYLDTDLAALNLNAYELGFDNYKK